MSESFHYENLIDLIANLNIFYLAIFFIFHSIIPNNERSEIAKRFLKVNLSTDVMYKTLISDYLALASVY